MGNSNKKNRFEYQDEFRIPQYFAAGQNSPNDQPIDSYIIESKKMSEDNDLYSSLSKYYQSQSKQTNKSMIIEQVVEDQKQQLQPNNFSNIKKIVDYKSELISNDNFDNKENQTKSFKTSFNFIENVS